MDSNQYMTKWSAAWALIGGLVVCTQCMRAQSISQSGEPFAHEPHCKSREELSDTPWADLHQILDKERG